MKISRSPSPPEPPRVGAARAIRPPRATRSLRWPGHLLPSLCLVWALAAAADAQNTPIAYDGGSETGTLNPGEWAYFDVVVAANAEGFRTSLTGTGVGDDDVDLYIRQNTDPTLTASTEKSLDSPLDRIFITNSSGISRNYTIGVHLPADAAAPSDFTLLTHGQFYESVLAWDDGSSPTGTSPVATTSTGGGPYYYKVVTNAPVLSVWRVALKVTSGEADLYARQNSAPTTTSNTFESETAGSDGFTSYLSPVSGGGQEWYFLVDADPGTSFEIIAGDIHVQDLGTLAAGASSGSGLATIPPEGGSFFRTSIPVATLGWRLWLQQADGVTNWEHPFYVREDLAPHPSSSTRWDRERTGQGLLVPDYIDPGGGSLYYVGIFGEDGTQFQLDSRQHEVTDILFDASAPVSLSNGYRFKTYRVFVPVDRIAWEITMTPTTGDPSLAIREGLVPNPFNNACFSEAPGAAVADSISVVPPNLNDGSWYITTYSDAPYTGTLVNREPTITDIDYATENYDPLIPASSFYQVVNDETNRSGWRYYRVSDVAPPQLGSPAWLLELENQVPGTEIAIRRNFVPGRWSYREDGSATVRDASQQDQFSTLGFLQDLTHQTDIWYVGIYTPEAALGAFTLKSGHIAATNKLVEGGGGTVTNLAPKRWEFFRMVVPAQIALEDVLGWQLRVENWSGSRPDLVIRRDQLPQSIRNVPSSWLFYNQTNWPTGYQGSIGETDWTERRDSADGTQQWERFGFWGALGRPLEPATYYVGFFNNSTSVDSTFSFTSEAIGNGMSIEPQPLAYGGGVANITNLPAREIKYFYVDITANTPSWRVSLANVSGESALFIRRGTVPTIRTPADGNNSAGSALVELQRDGDEHYTMLPETGDTFLPEGRYYLLVASEGQNPGTNQVGTGSSSATLTSHGPADPPDDFGTPTVGVDFTHSDSYEAGRINRHQFTVPAGINAVELYLEAPTGQPTMHVRREAADTAFPSGGGYGHYSGYSPNATDTSLVTLNNPPAGSVWRIVVKDAGGVGSLEAGSYTLRIRTVGQAPVTFDGDSQDITGVGPETWRFFEIVIPAQIGGEDVLGWQLRCESWTGARPRMVVRRDEIPQSTSNIPGSWLFYNNTTSWPTGYQASVGYADWTDRRDSEDNSQDWERFGLWAGMGRPLEPGTYYVGMYNPSTTTACDFTLSSSAIGTGMSLEPQPIAFNGGVANIVGLPARDVEYYYIDMPASTPSWRVSLTNDLGESALYIRRGVIPTVRTPADGNNSAASALVELHRDGDEHYTMLPESGDFLPEGRYYLMVVSEGENPGTNQIGTGSSSATLTSHGPADPPDDLGTPAIGADLVRMDSYEAGRVNLHKFTIPAGVNAVELSLENTTGEPTMYVRQDVSDEYFPRGGPYGYHAGSSYLAFDQSLISLNNPSAGNDWRVVVMDNRGDTAVEAGSYTLRARVVGDIPLTFSGGLETLSGVRPETWRFFPVTIPPQVSGENVLGWQLRVESWSGARPRMIIRREAVPQSLSNIPSSWLYYSNKLDWPSGNQASVGTKDWTDRRDSGDNSQDWERFGFWGGMGRPLEPGDYYVGLYNPSTTTASDYTLSSTAIGTGMGLDPQMIAFNGGSAAITDLPARDVRYHYVDIPADTPSWRVSLVNGTGENALYVRRGVIPTISTSSDANNSAASELVELHRDGDEHYVMLPENGETVLQAGRYYLQVVSEGLNPGNNQIGTGNSSSILTSHGPVIPSDLGSLASGGQLTLPLSYAGGEVRLAEFDLPVGTPAVEVKLENRVGDPKIYLLYNDGTDLYPDGGTYGHFSGYAPTVSNVTRVTVPNAPVGSYRMVIMDPNTDVSTSAGSCDLVVTSLVPTELNFSASQNGNGLSNVAGGILADDERHFFEFTVPATLGGQAVIGWSLDLDGLSGTPELRVQPQFLPDGVNGPTTLSLTDWEEGGAVIVPPELAPGTWYVEVRGDGASEYQLTSEAVLLERDPWVMPGTAGSSTTPGLSGAFFADTGIDQFGIPLPGDQGVDLANGDYHFYAFDVPDGNTGVIRIQLEAISGNPDLYLRHDRVPTREHDSPPSGPSARSLFDEGLTATAATEYGNFVPTDGRTEMQLAPGRWYASVRAAGGGNARYRMILSKGTITDVALDGGLVSNVTLAAGDWRYFRFTVPLDAPTEWTFSYAQTLGDVDLHVRDTIPPGYSTFKTSYGGRSTQIRDWADDNKTSVTEPDYPTVGDYTISPPLLEPGRTYYLGFEANSDAVFDLSSSVSGTTIGIPPLLDFFNGYVNTSLLPGERLDYRVDVPLSGSRWIHSSVRSGDIEIRIEQGSLAAADGLAHYRSSNPNSSYNRLLSSWPWVPGQTFYVSFINESAVTEPLEFTMMGESNLTWAAWAAGEGLPTDPSRSVEDNNFNGLPDLFDYALVPQGAAGALSVLPELVNLGDRIGLRFTIHGEDRFDLSLEVEATDDLSSSPWPVVASKSGAGSWSGSVTVAQTPVSGGNTEIVVPFPATFSESSVGFMRLRLSLDP